MPLQSPATGDREWTRDVQEGAMTKPQSRRWLGIREFADELGVPMSTAYKWSAAGVRSGRFPRHTKLPNGCIRIRRDWLDAWLADHEAS